jgi:HlyD family secretion protein
MMSLCEVQGEIATGAREVKVPGQGTLFRWLALLIVGCGSAAGGFVLCRSPGSAPAPELPRSPGEQLGRLASFGRLRTGPIQERVSALGWLEPRGEVIDIAGLMGDRLAKLEVKEGDCVRRDDVLGYLDSYAVRKAQCDAAAAQLADARAQLAADSAHASALLEEARVGLRMAQELGPLDIETQQAQVRRLECELSTARTDLGRARRLSQSRAVSPQELDQDTLTVSRATEELAAARAALAKARAQHELNLQGARARVEAAQAALRRAAALARIESLTKNAAVTQAELVRTILRAPSDGTILQIVCRPGEKVDQQPVLRMGDTSVMYAVAEVYETDVPLVKPGQSVRITSPALSEPLTGTVERLGRMIRRNNLLHVDPAADADTRVAQVWTRLTSCAYSGGLATRLTNLRVDVEIHLFDAPSEAPAPSGPSLAGAWH